MLTGLTGCAVGPNFISPPKPEAARFTAEKLPAIEGSKGSLHLVFGQDIPERWWQVFHNKALNDLVEASIKNNPTLPAAEAAIKVAYYNAEAQKGGFLPSAIFNSSDSSNYQGRNQFATSPGGPTNPYAIFLKQLTVSYTPDVWGGNRRAVESLEAQTDQQRYQLEAAYLTLTTNVITGAINEASLRGQIEAIQKVIVIERELLDLVRKQKTAGYAAETDVLTQETALAQALELLPPLAKQLAQQRDQLTALAGNYSGSEVPEKFVLKSIAVPKSLPVRLPSEFIRQRPDVRTAEANMHSASALIGVAVAARLPNITLSAAGGYSSYSLGQLLTPGSAFYTLTAGVTQPIFEGFTLLNKQKAAEAGLLQAEAQYRLAVITAFQNVADALQALQADSDAVKATVYAEDLALRNLEIVRAQLKIGYVNILTVLNAEQAYLQAVQNHVQAEGNRLADVAGLVMALGGDWKDQNLKNLPPVGPIVTASDKDKISKITDGPVNTSWIPSF